MMKKASEILLILGMALLVIVPFCSWTASVMGYPVNNLFSEESIRWMFLNGGRNLVPQHLGLIVLFLTSIGAVQESGIRLNRYKADMATRVFCVLMFTTILLICLPVMMGYSGLLGVTGSIVPSPWFAGAPYLLCLGIIFSVLVYAIQTSQLTDVQSFVQLLVDSLHRHLIWLYVAMLYHLLLSMAKYTLMVGL